MRRSNLLKHGKVAKSIAVNVVQSLSGSQYSVSVWRTLICIYFTECLLLHRTEGHETHFGAIDRTGVSEYTYQDTYKKPFWNWNDISRTKMFHNSADIVPESSAGVTSYKSTARPDNFTKHETGSEGVIYLTVSSYKSRAVLCRYRNKIRKNLLYFTQELIYHRQLECPKSLSYYETLTHWRFT